MTALSQPTFLPHFAFWCSTLSLVSLADKAQLPDSGRLISGPEGKWWCVSATGLLHHLPLNDDLPGDCHQRGSPLPVWSGPAHQQLPEAMGIAILFLEGKKEETQQFCLLQLHGYHQPWLCSHPSSRGGMTYSGLNVIRLLGCMMGITISPNCLHAVWKDRVYLKLPSSLASMQTRLVIKPPFGVMFVMSIWGSHSEKINGGLCTAGSSKPIDYHKLEPAIPAKLQC